MSEDGKIEIRRNTGLTVDDQVAIQAYVYYIYKTTPKDETKFELLRPYLNTVLEKSNNWLVYSMALL